MSFIYRIAAALKSEYGHPPNVLYLNPARLQRLLGEFGPGYDFEFITTFLGMEVLVYPDQAHPHVAWTPWPVRSERQTAFHGLDSP